MTEPSDGIDDAVAALLAEVADEFRTRLARGEDPDPAEYAARHPAAAAAVRGALAALRLAAPSGPPHRDAAPVGPDGRGELGDFRIVREVGRGGMGIVYEAEQVSLGRRVALKVLPFAATMDPRHLQRFKNEARAAASLKHDHIVQVYAVGTDRGVHFYAMEFVEGQTLAQLIDGLRPAPARPAPTDPTLDHVPGESAPTKPVAALSTERFGPRGRESYRAAARMIAEAADALEHAHALGIVHRDISRATSCWTGPAGCTSGTSGSRSSGRTPGRR
jgi:serine/threonine protein kinase